MAFPSRKETREYNTPPDLSSRAQYRSSSKPTNIRSPRGSISNSSVHTTSTAATRKDLFGYSENGPSGAPSYSHRKSSHSLEKPTFRFRNQSQSTVSTIREAGSIRSYTSTPTSKQEIRSSNMPSFEGGDQSRLPSTPLSSLYDPSTLLEPSSSASHIYGISPSAPLDNPLTEPYGDSQPFDTAEIPTGDKPSARHPSSLPLPTDPRMGATSHTHTPPSTKETSSSVSGTATSHKVYNTSSPSGPSSRRTSKNTVEYVKPSRSRQKATPFMPPTPAHPSQTNRANLADFYADPSPTAVLGTAPTAPLDGIPEVSFPPTPADSMGINSRSRGGSATTKGKNGMSHKRPEIAQAYDPVHFTHVEGGGGDVWDKMGHVPAQGISLPPPIPGAVPVAYPVVPKPVDAFAQAEHPAPQQGSAAVASLTKAGSRRREKKKDDKANGTDIVKRLKQICTDADLTQLYRNLVKIGQG